MVSVWRFDVGLGVYVDTTYTATTSSSGAFSVSGLSAGEYRLIFSQGGFSQRTMDGIQRVRRLLVGGLFEATLLGHAFNPDTRIASAAVMGLGETGSSHVIGAVRAALDHEDSRVQASAVEMLNIALHVRKNDL